MANAIDTIDKNIRVLIVDDYAATRDLIRAILRSVGFTEMSQAENGADAITLLHGEQFDLIICDWNMPQVTGLEVLKMVRDNPIHRNVAFIMLTAEAYKESIVAALEAGVTDYIAKPFTAEVLLSKIAVAMKGKKATPSVPKE